MTHRKVEILHDEEAGGKALTTLWDDVAYLGPMLVFLIFTGIGGEWKSLYPFTYVAKTIVVTLMLILLWKHYTKISWKGWWVGAIVGVLVAVQWIGMESLLLKYWPNYPRMKHEEFRPFDYFSTSSKAWTFIAVRWAGATLLVPVMEELFWRDFLWRSTIWPSDFKRARIGQWDWRAFLLVALVFGAGVHLEWITAIVCGVIYGLLLVMTRSLGACIIAHGVTNLLLGAYVLKYGAWHFW